MAQLPLVPVIEESGDPGLSLTENVEDTPLSVLDQGIVLALCLDVKNHNPMVAFWFVLRSCCLHGKCFLLLQDGLTTEEMKPYIARVLHKGRDIRTGHSDDNLDEADWMTYSTALLVKSMLEFENHRTMYDLRTLNPFSQ